jgi:hypothetical protein
VRDRPVLAERVWRRTEHEARTAITAQAGEAMAETMRDLIIRGQRIAEPRHAQRMERGVRALRRERAPKAIERVVLAGVRSRHRRVLTRIVEGRGRGDV